MVSEGHLTKLVTIEEQMEYLIQDAPPDLTEKIAALAAASGASWKLESHVLPSSVFSWKQPGRLMKNVHPLPLVPERLYRRSELLYHRDRHCGGQDLRCCSAHRALATCWAGHGRAETDLRFTR